MRYPHIDHHGTQRRVTGSCRQLHMAAGDSLLLNYGLLEGDETSADGRSGAGQQNVEFSLVTLTALIFAHVHIVQVGPIPYPLAAGYKGLILCSESSAKLLPIPLDDAFKPGFSRDQSLSQAGDKLATPPTVQPLLRFAGNQPALRTYTLAARERFTRFRLCRNRPYLSRHWRVQTRRSSRLPRCVACSATYAAYLSS